jgi:hypothetical protein
MPPHVTVHLPGFGPLFRQGAKHLLESTIVPLGRFYVLLTLVGLDGGLIAALSWSVLALARRAVLRRPIPAVLLLTTGLLIARTVLGLVTGSVFLYFLRRGHRVAHGWPGAGARGAGTGSDRPVGRSPLDGSRFVPHRTTVRRRPG